MNDSNESPVQTKEFFWDRPHWNEILQTLKHIQKTMATQADLDAAISALQTDLTTQIAAINAVVQAILDKTPPNVDFTPEVEQLNAIKTTLDGVVAQLPSTPTPPSPTV